jgi:hypothetical protein
MVTKVVYALVLLACYVAYPLYNLVIDSKTTHNADNLMPPSTDSSTVETVYRILVASTVFSAIRLAGKLCLFCYKVINQCIFQVQCINSVFKGNV